MSLLIVGLKKRSPSSPPVKSPPICHLFQRPPPLVTHFKVAYHLSPLPKSFITRLLFCSHPPPVSKYTITCHLFQRPPQLVTCFKVTHHSSPLFESFTTRHLFPSFTLLSPLSKTFATRHPFPSHLSFKVIHRIFPAVVSSLGLQHTTLYASGRRETFFLPHRRVKSVLIVEGITMQKILFYLAIVFNSEGEGLIQLN